MELTKEQKDILDNKKKNLIVSASAGSGKTFVVIEYLKNLICNEKVPLSRMLVLTFTKAAAGEMKTRLTNAILESQKSDFLISQLDALPLADISTIHAFCEKLLKKYSSLISLPQNFLVLDEKESWTLKNRAFSETFEYFAGKDDEDFDAFYLAFKKNKEAMLSAVEGLSTFLESQKEGEILAKEFIENYEKNNFQAKAYLCEYLKQHLSLVREQVISSGFMEMESAYQNFGNALLDICNISLSDDFLECCKMLSSCIVPAMPRNKTEQKESKELLSRAKETMANVMKFVHVYDDYDEVFERQERDNKVAKALVKMFEKFEETYSKMKGYKKALDFSDLERETQKLFSNEEIAKDLQNKYRYIFVDEYQDTNPLQEAFIKVVAGKGNFVAVGDPKQGIYGFRNASMEIMKNDIESFSSSSDGQALYLNGNFRSDDNILQFVNTIFDKHMTMEKVGFDYAKTSRLRGLASFKSDGMKPALVYVALLPKEKKETLKGVYSVKDATLSFTDSYDMEVKSITSLIEQYLSSNIYDSKKETFRPVKEGDIVILFRKRSDLMREVARYLEKQGYNVVCDGQNSLINDGEIASILSLAQFVINPSDEVCLASCMASFVGGFSYDELAPFKASKEKSFSENVLESDSEKVKEFLRKMKNFALDINIRGLSQALRSLLNESGYYVYQQKMENSEERKLNLESLFKIIKSGNFDYDIEGLLSYLKEGKGMPQSKGSTNAITLTTIHATKGLEYPIVILAGGGESLGKADISQINYTSQFGLGTNLYDFDKNIKLPAFAMTANKVYKQKREFIDEIMIFYVALTRAKNHLAVVGSLSQDGVKKLYQNKNYLALILNSYGESFAQTLFDKGEIKKENVSFCVIDSVSEEPKCEVPKEEQMKEFDTMKLKKYFDFVYPNRESRFEYKNSVTGLMSQNHDERKETSFVNERENTDEKDAEKNLDDLKTRQEAIICGNAYHEALKIVPFDKIEKREDIDTFLNQDDMSEGYYEKVDKDLLYKNIVAIKSVLKNKQYFKEKEFIMNCSLRGLGKADSDEKVIVQGIIDLFSPQDEGVLIDYKYTSQKNDNKIKERYISQIKLYENALEKAFNKKIKEKYILSLKDAKIIRID